MSRRRRRPQPQPDPFGLEALGAEHLEKLRVRNYSPVTIKNRKSHLKAFRLWCEERGITRPREITLAVLERYQQWLAHHRKPDGRPLSWRCQAERLIAVKMLLRGLVRDRHLLYNPAAELELPRVPQRLPRDVLTAAEAEEVLAQPDVATPLGVRDRAILETFYSTGMRRLELIRLELPDVDLERGTVFIREGKGKKDRVVPLGARAAAWVEKYLREVRPLLAVGWEEGWVFLTHRGRRFAENRMSELCHRYVVASGVGKVGSCHIFRHTAATLMLEGGADVRFIQQLLGHEHLDSTEVYTRVSIRKLQEVHRRTHPGAELGRHSSEGGEGETAAAELWEALASEASEEGGAGDA
jgi:integrase/recombinase XerD